jgi:hypothetical protein
MKQRPSKLLTGYSLSFRFDALESKQLNSELNYLRLREGVEQTKYRVQEVQASFETIANSVGISLSGIDLFTGKSVEPPTFIKPLESRPVALSAEMFGLPSGPAFQKLALASFEGVFKEGLEASEVGSSHGGGDGKRGLSRLKTDPNSGLIYIPGPLNGIPPETAVDITRALKILHLKLERLLEVSAGLPAVPEHGYGHGYDPGLSSNSERTPTGVRVPGRLAANHQRVKEMRSLAFHKLMDALEWLPPSEKLPEKPKDPKEAVDKTAMTAAVSSYIAHGSKSLFIYDLLFQ